MTLSILVAERAISLDQLPRVLLGSLDRETVRATF
jgi:hypothetical protein